jgi:putative ABC transport system permease protein
MAGAEELRSRPLMRAGALIYLYRRRLRVHAVQETLAGLGVAIGVALVFATIVAASSIAGSAGEVVRAVTGPASLQLRARGGAGFPESVLREVQRLPGVKQAAPLLEQTATIAAASGRRVTVDLAGTDTSLVVLDGLAHTLPTSTLSAGGIGLARSTAQALGIATAGTPMNAHTPTSTQVSLSLGGRVSRLRVSAVLGPETFGALSQARVAVMPLAQLQRLAGLQRRITRVLVQTRPGAQRAVGKELTALAKGRLDVVAADQDVDLLRQALRPSDEASAFFAAVSALLGLLFALAALLLTVPERRRAIADLRLNGAKRSAIAQLLLFQALALGLAASILGVLCGYVLSLGAFAQSTGYLAEAFTLGTRTIVGTQPLEIALLGGVLATCLASAAPLIDLRPGRTLDAIYRHDGAPGNALTTGMDRMLGAGAGVLLAAASILFATTSSHALLACALLALATVLSVPFAFAAVLRSAAALARRRPRLTLLPVALSSLRATTLRSLALAATGGLALFGSIALGGARGDLMRGIERFARSYSSDAQVWVGNPGDNQAVVALRAGGLARRIAHVSGVARVSEFAGGFMALGGRRVWVIARPPGAASHVLESQIAGGSAPVALRRLAQGGWIAVSEQIAGEHHTGVGGSLELPTPSGPARLRIAATTTNLAWSPGVVFIGSTDYARLWRSDAPSAFGVTLSPGVGETSARRAIERALGTGSGLEVITAREREARIDALTSEGLAHLDDISTLLEIAAILALAAALTSAIWQRRTALAGLRLAGVRPRRLRLILLVESALMLGAGCATGALAGIYGQLVIDGYLGRVTGFPLARLGAGLRPLEIPAVVIAIVLAIVAVPGWRASRVSPRIALDE